VLALPRNVDAKRADSAAPLRAGSMTPQPPSPRAFDAAPEVDNADVAGLLHAAAAQDGLHVFVLLDARGVIRWVNETAVKVFNRPREALLGKPLAVLFRPGDIESGTVALELESATACGHAENDRWMQRGDGSAFWAHGATTVIRGASGEPVAYLKLLRNRTDIREHMLALRNERDALADERDVAASRLAKNAHELRNPLGAIASGVEVLRRLAGDVDTRVVDTRADVTAERLRRQIDQLARLVDELMASAGSSALAQRSQHSCVVMQEAIATALETVAPAPADLARVSCLLQPTPVVADIDPGHLQQILVNLIGNALKYSGATTTVWVRLSTEADEAVVRIEDRGVGIAPDTLSQIFELFTRAPGSGATPGSGVGLAVVRELVALYGGSVLAQSEGVGRGAIFTLRLPRVDAAAMRDEAAAVASAAPKAGAD
jgi:PAS domain S-box-containing protein